MAGEVLYDQYGNVIQGTGTPTAAPAPMVDTSAPANFSMASTIPQAAAPANPYAPNNFLAQLAQLNAAKQQPVSAPAPAPISTPIPKGATPAPVSSTAPVPADQGANQNLNFPVAEAGAVATPSAPTGPGTLSVDQGANAAKSAGINEKGSETDSSNQLGTSGPLTKISDQQTQALQGAKDVAQTQYGISRGQAIQQQDIAGQALGQAQNYQAQMNDFKKQYQDYVTTQRDATIKATGDLQNASKIDPGRLFSGLSPGVKIMGALGVFALSMLGNRGASNMGMFSPSKNGKVSMMDPNMAGFLTGLVPGLVGAVNNDVKLQQARFSQAKDNVEQQQTLFGKLVTSGQDQQQAIENTSIAQLQAIKAKAQQYAAQYSEPNAKLAMQDTINKIDQEIAKHSENLQGLNMVKFNNISGQANQGARTDINSGATNSASANTSTLPPNSSGEKRFNAQVNAINRTDEPTTKDLSTQKKIIERLVDLRDKYSKLTLGDKVLGSLPLGDKLPTTAAEYNAVRNEWIQNNVKGMEGSDAEQARMGLESTIPKAGDFSTAIGKVRLDSAITTLIGKYQEQRTMLKQENRVVPAGMPNIGGGY